MGVQAITIVVPKTIPVTILCSTTFWAEATRNGRTIPPRNRHKETTRNLASEFMFGRKLIQELRLGGVKLMVTLKCKTNLQKS
jgi:hypothetical protein